jgi:PhnB protein
VELETYLHFSGNCEEALAFYGSIFGGGPTFVSRYGGSPMMTHAPAGWEHKVLHASFEAPGVRFMASDSSHARAVNGRVSLSVSTADPSEGERVFLQLADGGTISMPFQDTFWGARFGMLTDKFGIDWMVNCGTSGG